MEGFADFALFYFIDVFFYMVQNIKQTYGIQSIKRHCQHGQNFWERARPTTRFPSLTKVIRVSHSFMWWHVVCATNSKPKSFSENLDFVISFPGSRTCFFLLKFPSGKFNFIKKFPYSSGSIRDSWKWKTYRDRTSILSNSFPLLFRLLRNLTISGFFYPEGLRGILLMLMK